MDGSYYVVNSFLDELPHNLYLVMFHFLSFYIKFVSCVISISYFILISLHLSRFILSELRQGSEVNYCTLNSTVPTSAVLPRLPSQFLPSAHENGCFVSTPIVKIKAICWSFRSARFI